MARLYSIAARQMVCVVCLLDGEKHASTSLAPCVTFNKCDTRQVHTTGGELERSLIIHIRRNAAPTASMLPNVDSDGSRLHFERVCATDILIVGVFVVPRARQQLISSGLRVPKLRTHTIRPTDDSDQESLPSD